MPPAALAFGRKRHNGAMSELKTAIVAGGCFWCTEAVFLDVKGVTKVESHSDCAE